jgi:hypothetical protein
MMLRASGPLPTFDLQRLEILVQAITQDLALNQSPPRTNMVFKQKGAFDFESSRRSGMAGSTAWQ